MLRGRELVLCRRGLPVPRRLQRALPKTAADGQVSCASEWYGPSCPGRGRPVSCVAAPSAAEGRWSPCWMYWVMSPRLEAASLVSLAWTVRNSCLKSATDSRGSLSAMTVNCIWSFVLLGHKRRGWSARPR